MSLGSRIKQKLEENEVKAADLARAVKKTPVAAKKWLDDTSVPTAENLKLIAKFLGVTDDWLLFGKEADDIDLKKPQNMNFVPPVDLTYSENPRQTPVLSWVQAGDFSYVLSSDLSSAIDWIPYDPRAGKSGFALIVKGTSMEPDFKPNEFIYINPTYQIDELHTGALVVMACEGDTEATFKKLISEDDNYYLQPLNPNWHPQLIELDHTCRLVGKVVGKYTRY